MYAFNLECGHRLYQQWVIILQKNGASRIQNLETNKCLGPVGPNNQTQYICTDNDPSLNWILTPSDSPGNKTLEHLMFKDQKAFLMTTPGPCTMLPRAALTLD